MTPAEHRAAVLAQLSDVAAAVAAYNLTDGRDNPITGIDLQPGDDLASDDPVLEVRADGAARVKGYSDYIAESAASDDKWRQRWAAERAVEWGMWPEVAQRAGLTQHQRDQILVNCGRAGMWVRHRTGDNQVETVAKSAFFAFVHGPNWQPVERIADAQAFAEAKPQSGFSGALLKDARRIAQVQEAQWIAQAKIVGGHPTPGFGG